MEKSQHITSMKAFRFLSSNLVNSGMQVLNIIDPDRFPMEEDEFNDAGKMRPVNGFPPMRRRDMEPKSMTEAQVIKTVKYLDFLSEYLHLNRVQTAALVAIASKQIDNDNCSDVDDICRFFCIGAIEGMPFKKILESMESAGYLKMYNKRFHGCGYSCQDGIIDCIVNNEEFTAPDNNCFTRYNFCTKVNMYIDSCNDESITPQKLFRFVENLEEQYQSMEYVKKVQGMLEDVVDRVVFYDMCYDISTSLKSSLNIEGITSTLFSSMSQRFRYADKLRKENTDLSKAGLVEVKPSNMANDCNLVLSEYGKSVFFEDDFDLICSVSKNDPSIISPSSIKDVKLFYDDEFNKKASSFRNAMTEENLVMLQNRLSERSLPTGVAAIFYGAPGTGKTELVKQIAKETGRSIMHVDISQTKSCWVGDSEKRVKDIFVRYRRLCKQEKLKPILLFNEADAIFTKRMDASSSNNSSVVQMLNAMQNIILEEMETLDGILIATTNLQASLDDAFSRRFLYKLEFNKPSTEAKVSIWKSKMPDLSDTDARTLAIRYDLSGGEIDNVVRKSLVEEVVSGDKADFNTLCQFCEMEKFANTGRKRVGF